MLYNPYAYRGRYWGQDDATGLTEAQSRGMSQNVAAHAEEIHAAQVAAAQAQRHAIDLANHEKKEKLLIVAGIGLAAFFFWKRRG